MADPPEAAAAAAAAAPPSPVLQAVMNPTMADASTDLPYQVTFNFDGDGLGRSESVTDGGNTRLSSRKRGGSISKFIPNRKESLTAESTTWEDVQEGEEPESSGLKQFLWRNYVETTKLDEQERAFGATYAFGCLHVHHPVRWRAIRIVTNPKFDLIVIGVIFLNCIALAAYDPTAEPGENEMNNVLDIIEFVFLALFTIEMLLKMTAYGFVADKGTYLRDHWNQLDFLIVCAGYLDIILTVASDGGDEADVKALRAARVLRSLRVVHELPSLARVINSIVAAFPRLLHVGLLAVAIVILWGIMGVTFFGGKLDTSCFYNATNERVDERPCTTVGDGYHCPFGQYCKGGVIGPNNGITSFDNIGLSMLNVMQCMSLEGWTDIWYYCNDAVGRELPWLYFTSLIIFGAFLVLNLVLGVISGEFSKEGQRMERRRRHLRNRKKKERAMQLENYTWWVDATDDLLNDIVQSTQMATLKFSDKSVFEVDAEDEDAVAPALTVQKVENDKDRMLWAYRVPWAAAWVKSKWFTLGVMFVVFVNTILLASDHAFQSEEWSETLRVADFVFISIFVLEMAVKMWALGVAQYWSFKFNRFDFVVVIISIIEIISVETLEAQPMGLSVFRSVRLLRLMRFTSYWTVLSELVDQIVEDLASVLSLLGVLQVLILIYALLGMQMFGGRYDSDVRINFNNFWNAYVSVFSILTGENWNEAMYNGINAYGGIQNGGGWISLYFLSLVILGNYVVLNIFLAIAVESLEIVQASISTDFDDEAQKDNDNEMESFAQKRARRKSQVRALTPQSDEYDATDEEQVAVVRKFGESDDEYNVRAVAAQQGIISDNRRQPDSSKRTADDLTSSKPIGERRQGINYLEVLRGKNEGNNEVLEMPPHTALGCLTVDNTFRQWAFSVVTHKRFDDVILIFIVVSSLALAIEDPVNRDAEVNEVLRYFDFVFAAIFTAEMLLKWVSLGLIGHDGAYMRSGWNNLDMFIVFSSLIAIILVESLGEASEASSVRILRLMRVLRPLRSVHRIPKLQMVVECLFQSVRNITSIFLLAFTFTFFFAIIGVQLMKGSFFRCKPEDPYIPEQDCVGNYTVLDQFGFEVGEPRHWGNAYMNFDNSPLAMQALFAAATTEGWLVTLFNAIDSVGEGYPMQENYDPGMALFLILYMVIVSFYMMNLFIGFVIVTFSESIEEGYAEDPLDKNDRESLGYIFVAKTQKLWRPDPKRYPFRRVFYDFTSSKYFRDFIGFLIFLNLIVLMMYHHDMSEEYATGLFVANCLFTALFSFEAVVKLYALTPTGYFDDDWNTFDFLIVVGSIVDAALEGGAINLTFLRLFRALRVVRLMKRGELKRLLYTFIQSFKDLPYVALLLFLVFFLYGVIGMQVFGRIELHEDMPINRNANFQTFPMALGLLFRCCTGEDWQVVMEGLYIKGTAPCDENAPGGSTCGVQYFNVIYMNSFVVSMSFLVLNLFVAVIIDNFSFLTEDSSTLNVHSLYDIVSRWPRFDEDADGKIHCDDLPKLLRQLDPPLGLGKRCTRVMVYRILSKLNINIDEEGRMDIKATLLGTYMIRRGNRKKLSKFFADKSPWPQWPVEEIRENLLLNPRYNDEAVKIALPDVAEQARFEDPCNSKTCKGICRRGCPFYSATQQALDRCLDTIKASSKRYYLMLWCQGNFHKTYSALPHQCATCSRKFKKARDATLCPCPWKEWKSKLMEWQRRSTEGAPQSWAQIGKFGWREVRRRHTSSQQLARSDNKYRGLSTLLGLGQQELDVFTAVRIADAPKGGSAWVRLLRLDSPSTSRDVMKVWNFVENKFSRMKFEGGKAFVDTQRTWTLSPFEEVASESESNYEKVAFETVIVPQGAEEVEYGQFIEGAYAHGVDHKVPLDRWDGPGMVMLPDGSWYQGDFANGHFHGHGEFLTVLEPTERYPYRKGEARYIGGWKHGMTHGKGLLVYPNGSWYYGDWMDGVMQGWGTFSWGDGVYKGSMYRGPWVDGQMQTNNAVGQKGVMIYGDGRAYIGQMKDGYPNGQGDMVWFTKGERSSDEIFGALPEMLGLTSGHRRYTGEWLDGMRHGHGIHKLSMFHHEDGLWDKDRFVTHG